ncbi:putative L-asparaginase [Glonium stellatum]|uniref:Putative L-asparaginase n=1 Tax=Glonium stellatum TaxID=574774 RepID=A0A8E2F900_9PEZI|nr:putative L-asparaginase [Glonium stellatum]
MNENGIDLADMASVQPHTSKICFALHAGTTESWETNLERQQEIDQVLSEVSERAYSSLSAGISAVDVVQAAVVALEDFPLFNAGLGAALNEDGIHELEAAIIDGSSGRYGAVAGNTTTRNPINAARTVLDSGKHSFIFGPAADELAQAAGLQMVENSFFTTPIRKLHWEARRSRKPEIPVEDSGTVGAVALDIHGRLAAAGSTGGATFKAKGRLGDTAVIGAGILANERVAVVCSGSGDDILREMLANKISFLQKTKPLSDAVTQAPCGVVALDSTATSFAYTNGRVFWTASSSSSGPPQVSFVQNNVPLFPQHIFYDDGAITAGLTRYPISPGQTVITTPGTTPLMSLDKSSFLAFMMIARRIAGGVRAAVLAKHCGLVSNGGDSVSLLPFPQLKATGIPIDSNELEYYAVYPGYLSSKNGPKMDPVTGLTEPFNNAFYGEPTDNELFARLIRQEIPQWRIWEDKAHVAFLTPTGKTPGPDILLLNDQDYEDLLTAAYTVAQHLKKALQIRRCGMFFEGFEGDYAHVKLIPVHEPTQEQRKNIPIRGPAAFSENYRGFLTTELGPRASNFDKLPDLAAKIRELTTNKVTLSTVPKSWKHPESHALAVLESPWYTAMFRMQSTMYHEAIDLFNNGLGYEYTVVPVTSSSVSSPMGLGSDSDPVAITLDGLSTHLADSQQFALEYALRLQEGLKGAYYVGTSCRGEDTDAMHLNQFCHFECELPGSLDDGIAVAERYIIHMTVSLLEKHKNEILSFAGTTAHMEDILRMWRFRGGNFPRVSLDDALKLPEITQEMWRYVVPERPEFGKSLTRKGELVLIKRFGGAVWLTEMDHQSVPFYQAYADENCMKARCADFLIGLGEIMGCGCRHATAESVIDALARHEVDANAYAWYIDMRRLKAMETVGWGMGIERYLCWVMKHDDVRDVQIIPRFKGVEYRP